MKLAQAAGLGLFIAEAGAGCIIELHGQRVGVEMRLDERAHRAGGSLGLEGDGAVALVVERVHFLLHHVGGVAHAALEQLGVLENGRADLAIACQCADAAHVVLDGLPAIRVLRQHVQSALGCLGQHVGKTPFVIEWRKQKNSLRPDHRGESVRGATLLRAKDPSPWPDNAGRAPDWGCSGMSFVRPLRGRLQPTASFSSALGREYSSRQCTVDMQKLYFSGGKKSTPVGKI